MVDPSSRQPNDIRDMTLGSMDRMFGQLMDRLVGLTDSEYLWEPVPGMWSVRSVEGQPVVDGAGVRDPSVAPVTTISWRLWHLALDCFDDYTRRFAGDLGDASAVWTLDAAEAIEMLRDSWAAYRGAVEARDWWGQLGQDWGPWSNHTVADMTMHAGNELVHHGAEIALLRDLYRSSQTTQLS